MTGIVMDHQGCVLDFAAAMPRGYVSRCCHRAEFCWPRL